MGRFFTHVITLLVLFSAIACTDSKSPDAAGSTHLVGGELRVRRSTLPTAFGLDPHLATLAADFSVDKQLFRGLLWYDKSLKLSPMAASEVPSASNGGISRDGLVYTFRLRDGLKWSDGEPLTAFDFEYSFKRLLDPKTKGPRASTFYSIQGAERFNTCRECTPSDLLRLRDEVGVRAVNDKTLVFTLKNPRATFPYLMTLPAASPVRRDVIEKYGNQWTDPANIVGNGPFTLRDRSDQVLVLEPNPHWWGRKSELSRVDIKIIGDPNDPLKPFNAYRLGELDIVEVPPEALSLVQEDPRLKSQNIQVQAFTTYGYFFNSSQPPFDNKLVRQAFSLAVDREALVSSAQQGGARVGYSLLPPGMPGHQPRLGQQWTFNPAKARSMLAEAGFPGAVGLPKIKYIYNTSGSLNKDTAENLQRQLERNLGVYIELQAMDLAPWREEFAAGRLQIIFTGLTANYYDPEELFDYFACQKYMNEECVEFSGSNLWHYSNEEVDRLLLQTAKETDAKRRLRLYERAQAILVDDAPAIFVSYRTRNLLVNPEVRGLLHTGMDVLPAEYFLENLSLQK